MSESWTLLGYDAFIREFYPLGGKYPDELSAYIAALARLETLEEFQPTARTGGQAAKDYDPERIQDQVFVVRPDGTRFRILPKELQGEL